MNLKELTNQTLYQCEYCGKRLLTKYGAILHENEYCRNSEIILKKGLDKIKECGHEWITVWSPIYGEEHLKEPDYDVCKKCCVHSYELREDLKANKSAMYRAFKGSEFY